MPCIKSGQGVRKMNLLKEINEIGLLTEEEMKRLENRMERNPDIRDEVGGKYEDYKIYVSFIEGIGKILPMLKKYTQVVKKEFEI